MNRKTVIIFGVGVLSGIALSQLRPKEKAIGTLRIDESDPNDEPYMFLELTQNVGVIRSKKQVTLDVLDKNYLSAK